MSAGDSFQEIYYLCKYNTAINNKMEEVKEFIIGRGAEGMVVIPEGKKSVSHNHAKITINPDGTWILEDLKSANGTFIRNNNGDFRRVSRLQITPDTTIRLGTGDTFGFTFMAHHVIADSPESYEYEFRQLSKAMELQLEAEHEKEKVIERNGWIAKCSGLLLVLPCMLLGGGIDPTTRYILIAVAPVLVGFIFKNDMPRLKAIRKRREKVIVCPKCDRPLSEFDVTHKQCSRCKAH